MPSRGAGFWTYRRGGATLPAPPFTFTAAPLVPFGEAVIRVGDATGRLIGQLFGRLEAVSWHADGYGAATLLLPPSALVDVPRLLEFGNRVRIDFTHGLQPWAGVIDPPREVADGVLRLQMYEPGYLLEQRLTPRRLEFYGNAGPLGAARDLLKRTDAGWRVEIAGDDAAGVTADFAFARVLDALLELRQVEPRMHFALGLDERDRRDIRFRATLFLDAAKDATERAVFRQGGNLAGVRVIDQGPLVNRVIVATGDADLSAAGGTDAELEGYLYPGEQGEIFAAVDRASAARYGLREEVVVLSDVSGAEQPGLAAAYAAAYLKRYGRPTRRVAGTAVNLPPGRWGDFRLGSRVTVELTGGMYQRGYARQALVIVGMEYAPAAGTLELLFAEPPEVTV